MRKRIVALVILITFVAIAFLLLQENEHKPKDELTLYGHIEIRTVRLAFRESEIIKTIFVDEGDRISRGELLAELQNSRLAILQKRAIAEGKAQYAELTRLQNGFRPQEIAMAKAKVAAGEARIHRSSLLVQRLRNTTKQGSSSKQQLDNAVAELRVAQADTNLAREAYSLINEGYRTEKIEQAKEILAAKEQQINFINQQIKESKLYAPSPGVIQSRIAEQGELAIPQEPVLILSLTHDKWVRAYIPEPQMGLINLGMKAKIFSDSFAQPFTGKVGFISPQAEFTPKTVQTTELRSQLVYEVRINLEDPKERLRLGMPVTVIIDKKP